MSFLCEHGILSVRFISLVRLATLAVLRLLLELELVLFDSFGEPEFGKPLPEKIGIFGVVLDVLYGLDLCVFELVR